MNTEKATVGVERTTPEQDAGFAIPEILGILRRRMVWIAGVTGAFLIGALLYVSFIPPEWEAVAVVQIEQVMGRDTGGGPSGWTPIESPIRTQARIKLPAFTNDVLAGLGIPPESRETTLYRRTLKANALTNTDLLELRVRAYSREQAAQLAEATVARLSKVHEALSAPAKQRIQASLEEVRRDRENAESERARLLAELPPRKQVGPRAPGTENILYAMIGVAERTLRELEVRKRTLEEALHPRLVPSTSLVDRIYLPEDPAFPRKSLILGVAGAIGLLLGCLGALAVGALHRPAPTVTTRGDGQA